MHTRYVHANFINFMHISSYSCPPAQFPGFTSKRPVEGSSEGNNRAQITKTKLDKSILEIPRKTLRKKMGNMSFLVPQQDIFFSDRHIKTSLSQFKLHLQPVFHMTIYMFHQPSEMPASPSEAI